MEFNPAILEIKKELDHNDFITEVFTNGGGFFLYLTTKQSDEFFIYIPRVDPLIFRMRTCATRTEKQMTKICVIIKSKLSQLYESGVIKSGRIQD